jgi:hypothetical protein
METMKVVKAALSELLMESNKFDSPKRTLPRGGPDGNTKGFS